MNKLQVDVINLITIKELKISSLILFLSSQVKVVKPTREARASELITTDFLLPVM